MSRPRPGVKGPSGSVPAERRAGPMDRAAQTARSGVRWLFRSGVWILAVYAGISMFMIPRHEPWRDEAQAWLIARDAGNLAGLFANVRYEGSPGLWHLILYPFAHAGFPYRTMHVIHFGLAFAAMALCVARAPLPVFLRVLVPFGFFTLYQYNVVARSYVLVWLLLFAIGAVYAGRNRKPWLFALLVALLANTCAHALAIAFVITVLFGVERLLPNPFSVSRIRQNALPFGMIAAGAIAALWQLRSPADHGYYQEWNTRLGLRTWEVLRDALVGAFLPGLPISGVWVGCAAALILVVALAALAHSPKALLCFAGSLVAIWALFQLKHPGVYWHHGLILGIFLFSLWISGGYPPGTDKWLWGVRRHWVRRIGHGIVFLFLVLQMPGAWNACAMDVLFAYSGGKDAAAALRRMDIGDVHTLVATHKSIQATSILPYVSDLKKQFYSCESQRYYSFTVWDKKSREDPDLQEIVQRMGQEMVRGRYRRLIFVTPARINHPAFLKLFEPVAMAPASGRAMWGDEIFIIYLLRSAPERNK